MFFDNSRGGIKKDVCSTLERRIDAPPRSHGVEVVFFFVGRWERRGYLPLEVCSVGTGELDVVHRVGSLEFFEDGAARCRRGEPPVLGVQGSATISAFVRLAGFGPR